MLTRLLLKDHWKEEENTKIVGGQKLEGRI